MKTDLFDKTNKKVGTIELPDSLFAVRWNPDLVHQVFTATASNERRPWAHTKDRSEVRGSGKKPWRQKHTGRSRHGSTRSPLWAGGGVTFGPRKDKSYAKKVNAKMKRLALFSVLSKKVKDDNLKIVENFQLEVPKTKKAAEIVRILLPGRMNVLIVLDPKNKNARLAFRNIPDVAIASPISLNIGECLSHRNVFFEKEAIDAFIKKYEK